MRAGLVDHLEAGGKPIAASALVGYKCVKPPEIVMNRMRAASGLFAVASRPGLVSPDYAVFQPKVNVDPSYYVQLFKSPTMTKVFRMESKGLGTGEAGFMRLYTDRFGSIAAPLPPIDEQLAVVRFLAYFEQMVLRYVRTKMKVIALLNEQKQAIIHRAVTRGLDPNVRLKPSGVEWLGDVPEHWSIIPNRQLFREITRKYDGGKELRLSLSQRDGLIATEHMKERSLLAANHDNFKVCLPNDLVLNRFKAHLGVFFAASVRGIVTFHYGVFCPRVKMEPKYFELLFHTSPYKTIYAGASNGMTVGLQNLSNQNFYKVKSLMPPLSEQIDILRLVEEETHHLNKAIDKIQREINLVHEYRTRLVADVVTGKLEVCDVDVSVIGEAENLDIIENNELEADEPDDTEGLIYADD
jgi:type I restriction enzyme S subunit